MRLLLASGRKLAHYTTAHVAHSIISNAEIWMRNVQVMNDSSEVQHGLECIAYAKKERLLRQLFDIVDAAHPGLGAEIADHFDSRMNAFLYDTYLTCLSEFASPKLEDGRSNPDHEFGRLSMWRAYGGDNGVALILDPSFLEEGGDLYNVYTSPVYYGDATDFAARFADVVSRMRAIPDTLRRCQRDDLKFGVFSLLRFGLLSVKHPAFKEEDEWRVIYTPLFGESNYVTASVKTIRNVPQVVHTLKLVDDVENDVRLSPARLFESILIGPCEFPILMRQTFFDALKTAGVSEPAARVRASGIPVRR